MKRPPEKTEDGIPYYGGEADGDWFDQEDVMEWRTGRLRDNWESRRLLDNTAVRVLLDRIAAEESSLIDLAAGPGLGLLPPVIRLRGGFPCMATDANGTVLKEWRQYLLQRNVRHVSFIQCSLMDLPFADGTVQAFSSMIGLSSTRSGEDGYEKALQEVYRALKSGGKLYAVEAEWTNVPDILQLFERMNMPPWQVFLQRQISWRERFRAAGFTILYEKEAEYCPLRPDDNELGAAAAAYGVKVGLRRTAYILQK